MVFSIKITSQKKKMEGALAHFDAVTVGACDLQQSSTDGNPGKYWWRS